MTRSRTSPGTPALALLCAAAALSCLDPGAAAPNAIRSGGSDAGPPGVVPVDPCLDGDGDGFGVACRPGPDCDDQDPAVTNQCTACIRPNTHCPCAEGTPPIGCNVATGDNTVSPEGVCRLGQRVCRGGAWSACEALESNARFIGPASNCYGMCDPSCRHFVECPEAADPLPIDSTDVGVSNLPAAVFCPTGVGTGGIQPVCEPRPGDTYARSTSPATWVDACAAAGRTVLIPSADEAVAPYALPFTFAYWGVPYRTVHATTNGVLQFAPTVPTWVNTTLPQPAVPNAIFPFWDDLMTRSMGVCAAVVGPAGNRRAVFQWEDATFWPDDPATHLTFEVILGERDQTIDVLYNRMEGMGDRASGDSATIGAQQSIGTRFDLVSTDSPNAVSAGDAIRWSPDSNAQICRAGAHRRVFNAQCAPEPSGVNTVPVWGRLHYTSLVPPGAALRLSVRVAETAAGLLAAAPIRLPDAPTTSGGAPVTSSLDLGDILHATMRGLAHRPFVQLVADFDPGLDGDLAPRFGGLELQYHCLPVEDPYRCSAGSPCQLSNACRRGEIICPYTYGAECRDVGALPPGTSCGAGSVCNSAGSCVPCAEGVACDTGNVCTFGRVSCATGAPVCVVAGNRPPGTPCAFTTGNYTRGTSPLGFIDACNLPGRQVLLPALADGTVSVTLPFPFRFYGTQRTTMGVSVNGAIGFPSVTTAFSNATLPTSTLPDSIFPFWDDLQTRPAGICAATVGRAPDRLFVTQWSNTDLQDRGVDGDLGASLNFEVVLAEATQAVHVLYGDMVGDARATGSSATVGLQRSGSSTRYDLVSYNSASVAPNSSIQWTPPSTSACTGTGVCSPCTTAEICDGIDNNCNGLVDDGIANLTCGVGACRRTVSACVHATSQTCTPGTPTTEVCNSIDDDCDGMIDEACMGSITCPSDASMFAGDTRSFSVTTMGMLRDFAWSIVSGPAGGASSVVWSPAPPTATTESFRPIIVGVYRVRVVGTDGLNQVRSCEFNVTANSRGLRAELTWDGSGDVDIHMHNNVSGPWFNVPNDCHYRNMTPAWGAGLDVDNVTANGPENIRVNTPVVGQSYTVAVHNYARGAGRVATVRLYCGPFAGTTPSVVYNSAPLAGSSVGNCTGNTWWDVARVTINPDGTCVIVALDDYRTSSDACATR